MQEHKATKHNDYKRPGASMRRAAALPACFQCSCIETSPPRSGRPPHPHRYRPNCGVTAPFVKCRIDLKNEKCNSRLDEVRRGIVIASPGVCFELFSPPSGLRRSRKPRERAPRIVMSLSEII